MTHDAFPPQADADHVPDRTSTFFALGTAGGFLLGAWLGHAFVGLVVGMMAGLLVDAARTRPE